MNGSWKNGTKWAVVAALIAAASGCAEEADGSIEVRFSGQSEIASTISLERGELRLIYARFEPAGTADRFGEFAEIRAQSEDSGIAQVRRTVLTDTWALTATDAGTTHISFHSRNATRDIEVKVDVP